MNKQEFIKRLYEIEKSVSLCTLCRGENKETPPCWTSPSQQSFGFVPSLPRTQESKIEEIDESQDLITEQYREISRVNAEEIDKMKVKDNIKTVINVDLTETSLNSVELLEQSHVIDKSVEILCQKSNNNNKSDEFLLDSLNNSNVNLSSQRLTSDLLESSQAIEDEPLTLEIKQERVNDYLEDENNCFPVYFPVDPNSPVLNPYKFSDDKTDRGCTTIPAEPVEEAPRAYNSDIQDDVIPKKRAKIVANEIENEILAKSDDGKISETKKKDNIDRSLPLITSIEDLNSQEKIKFGNLGTKNLSKENLNGDTSVVSPSIADDEIFENKDSDSDTIEIPIEPKLNTKILANATEDVSEINRRKNLRADFASNGTAKVPGKTIKNCTEKKNAILSESVNRNVIYLRNKKDELNARVKRNNLKTRVDVKATNIIPLIDLDDCENSTSFLEKNEGKEKKEKARSKSMKHHLDEPEKSNSEIPSKKRRTSNTWMDIENAFVNSNAKDSLPTEKTKCKRSAKIDTTPTEQELHTVMEKHLISSRNLLSGMVNKMRKFTNEVHEALAENYDIMEKIKSMESRENISPQVRNQIVAETGTGSATASRTGSTTIGRTESAAVAKTGSGTVDGTGNAISGKIASATVAKTGNATFAKTESGTFARSESGTVAKSRNATVAKTGSGTVDGTGNAISGKTASATVAKTGNATFATTESGTFARSESATVAKSRNATVAKTGSGDIVGTRPSGSRASVSSSVIVTKKFPIDVEIREFDPVDNRSKLLHRPEKFLIIRKEKKKTPVPVKFRDNYLRRLPTEGSQIKRSTVDSANARAHAAIFNATFDEFTPKKRKG